MKYILNFLSGIELKNEVNCITLGAFSICNCQYLIEKFPEDFPKSNHKKEQKYLIYVTSQENLNTEIFKEIFDEKIKLFFNTLLYCLGKRAYSIQDTEFFNICSKNKNLYYTSEEFGLEMRGNCYKTICPTCRISDRFFKSTGNCIKLFEYIDQKPTSEIEQKIFLAVKWIGEGLTHSDLTIGYMCLCIALETLL
ncbi:MAG: hypothetical protein K2F57_00220, partial [Candidatus Gastranaerophilales bacterium]|nr:hypothetical protein [Candidatus Gastranaerophilales bacterium]